MLPKQKEKQVLGRKIPPLILADYKHFERQRFLNPGLRYKFSAFLFRVVAKFAKEYEKAGKRDDSKKIHYCWFGPKPFPELVVSCLKTWYKKLPDYELCLWNENNSPMQIPFVQQAYSAKKYSFVSDYVRFWALFNHGGIYLDTDMFLINNFDALLGNEIFFGWENKQRNAINGAIIGSVPEQPFIYYILKYYEQITFNNNNISAFVIPRIIGECYEKYELKNAITIYPFNFFYPFPYEEKEDLKNFLKYSDQDTIAIHLWNVSWGLDR